MRKIGPPHIPCPECGKKQAPHRMEAHLWYMHLIAIALWRTPESGGAK
jgi:hypothetical protein